MNKILICGVAGHLGVNLANCLLKNENNLVYGIDNFLCSSFSNISTLLKNERFFFLQQDLVDEINVKIDEIYFLAGCGDFSLYFDDKYKFCTNKLKSIENILKFSKIFGARLLYVTNFYLDYEFDDKYNSFNSLEKFIINLILDYSSINNTYAKIARVSDSYGPYFRFDDKRFIPAAIYSAFNNENIIIENDFCKYYTFSKDVSLGLINIMNNYLDKNIIDISSSNMHFDSDIAKLIISFTKSKSKVIKISNEIYYPKYTPDVNYLVSSLNFSCSTQILNGISKTVDFIKLSYFS